MQPPEIHLRPARPGDAPALAALLPRAVEDTYRGRMPDDAWARLARPETEAVWSGRIAPADPEARLFVAIEDGLLCGFVQTTRARDRAVSGFGEIQRLYLLPEAKGRGLGRRLLEHALEDFEARGFEAVLLWVLEANEAASAFYRRLGFRATGPLRRDLFHGHVLPHRRMERDLARNNEPHGS